MLLFDPFLAVLAFGRDKGMGMVFFCVTAREDDCARESIGGGVGAGEKGKQVSQFASPDESSGKDICRSSSDLPERVHAGDIRRHDVWPAVRRAESAIGRARGEQIHPDCASP